MVLDPETLRVLGRSVEVGYCLEQHLAVEKTKEHAVNGNRHKKPHGEVHS